MDINNTDTKRAPARTGSGSAQRRRRKSEWATKEHARRVSVVAKKATREAFETSLKSGLAVHVIEGGTVYRIAPNGKRVPVKQVAPPVPPGQVPGQTPQDVDPAQQEIAYLLGDPESRRADTPRLVRIGADHHRNAALAAGEGNGLLDLGAVERFARAARLGDRDFAQLHALECGEAGSAALTLSPPTDCRVVFGRAGVFDLSVRVSAKGTAQFTDGAACRA